MSPQTRSQNAQVRFLVPMDSESKNLASESKNPFDVDAFYKQHVEPAYGIKRRKTDVVGSLNLENKARDAMIEENFEIAFDFYNQAIEVDPQNPSLFADRAQACLKLEIFSEALADADRAIQLNGSMAKAHARKGRAFYELAKKSFHGLLDRDDAKEPENFEMPVDAYTRAISLDPSNPHLFAARAQANYKLHNFTEAVADAEKAIRLDRFMYKAYVRKGIALCELAKQSLEAALSLNPDDLQSFDIMCLCILLTRTYVRCKEPSQVPS